MPAKQALIVSEWRPMGSGKTEFLVLRAGARGTGKELAALRLANYGHDREGVIITLQLQAELFGYKAEVVDAQ